jgi:hypothetical protein
MIGRSKVRQILAKRSRRRCRETASIDGWVRTSKPASLTAIKTEIVAFTPMETVDSPLRRELLNAHQTQSVADQTPVGARASAPEYPHRLTSTRVTLGTSACAPGSQLFVCVAESQAQSTNKVGDHVIQGIARFFTQVVHCYLPDPPIFALILTAITFALAFGLTPQTPTDLVYMWGSGFWNLLAFTLQMAMILLSGHDLATSGPVKRFLSALGGVANTPAQAPMLVVS